MPGFAPTKLVRASFEKYGPPDVFLYNHYPLDPREEYESLCWQFDVKFVDVGYDRGLAKTLNYWIETHNVDGLIGTRDPDAGGSPGWKDAIEKVLSADPTVAIAALNLFVTEDHPKVHETIGGIECFSLDHTEAYSVAGWNLANMPRLFETISPYVRGFECRMAEIVRGRTVYLKDFRNCPEPHDRSLSQYRDPRYNEWQKQHYHHGLEISFAEYLKQ